MVVVCPVLLVILGAAFYWFQYRPFQVRKNCANLILIQIKEKGGLSNDDIRTGIYFCIKKYGISD